MNNENWDSVWEILDKINTMTGVNARVKNLNPEPLVFKSCINYNDIYGTCTIYGEVNQCDISCSYHEDEYDVY